MIGTFFASKSLEDIDKEFNFDSNDDYDSVQNNSDQFQSFEEKHPLPQKQTKLSFVETVKPATQPRPVKESNRRIFGAQRKTEQVGWKYGYASQQNYDSLIKKSEEVQQKIHKCQIQNRVIADENDRLRGKLNKMLEQNYKLSQKLMNRHQQLQKYQHIQKQLHSSHPVMKPALKSREQNQMQRASFEDQIKQSIITNYLFLKELCSSELKGFYL